MRASQVESHFFVASRLHVAPGLNTLAYAIRVHGAFDPLRFRAALESVICRHRCLRTKFELSGADILHAPLADWSVPELPDIEVPASADAVATALDELRAGLSPEDRTWAMAILRHAPQSHTLLFVAHRVAWDEASTLVFADELSKAYAADGASGDDTPPPVQTAGGSASQADGADAATSAPAVFAQVLDGIPRLHGFPLKAPRPRHRAVDADEVTVPMPADLATLLGARSSSWNTPVFMVECAAAAYVLAIYGGHASLALGMPFDLRSRGRSRSLGSQTAMLPVGVDTNVAGGFEAFARAFAERHAVLQAHASTPFDEIIAACKATSEPGANSLFQIACAEDVPFLPRFSGCTVESMQTSAPPQQLDLFLRFSPASLRVAYAQAIVAKETVETYLRSYLTFLGAALENPGQELSRLPILASADRSLASEGRGADEPSFLASDVYDLVTRHVAKNPDKVAVLCAGRSVSYAELDRLVGRAAANLGKSNLPSGSLVGICLPRSVEMLAALIAVLRQGMAYVPLDPAFPKDRLRYMVEHSKLACIVTNDDLRLLFEGVPVTFVGLEGDGDVTPAKRQAKPDDPAYVIYTSGSTGKPKGVVVPRAAMANFLRSMVERPGLAASDVLVAVTTLSFDIAVLELLAPLCAGATMIVATEEEAKDPRLLAALLKDHTATIMQATPVTWQMLLAANLLGERKIKALCGGEALSPALAQALAPKVAELWNMYGPTETTVWSTCHRIADEDRPISVGTPIHNTPVYIVDEHLRLLPRGVEGRLFIGGAGVALGYLHAPELTQSRFLPDPFLGKGRMYDTGDRGRLDSDGLLYILGRSDFQVKLRGFRIELGEIEARISAHPAVEQVVCVVRKDATGSAELVAYYVCRGAENDPGVSPLREHCSATLPSHMVPSRWVRLAALPRTPNGKIDRGALPSPSAGGSSRVVVETESASHVERTLCTIWSDLLSLPQVGVRENFFELGGTSLAAFQVVQRIAAALDVEISVVKIFEHPTIAALAKFLASKEADDAVVQAAFKRGSDRRKRAASPSHLDVAVVGMAGRFPGARNLDELWEVLRDGRETVTVWKREDLDPLVPDSDRFDPAYVPARGILENADLFDAAFFGITPNEAEMMDPQLRVFLEVAHEAFEHAGYVGDKVTGLVGVWAGMGNNFYYHHNVLSRPDKLAVMGDIAAEIANEKDHIAPRISYKLNLSGPSLSVHTACSTTLVVIENAYQALISGQVDMALAGGVDIRTPQKSGQRHEEGGPFSDDGHCRPFDAAATGTMFGEGAGALILKRLADAIADGDTVHGVIKGAAVNHDGSHKVSYLAPSVEGQAKVIAQAMGLGGVHPETITFVEAHGTATPIGDPIEVEALTRVHRTFTGKRHFCALGSIKGNIGHATTAAGIAGCLKTLLAMRHREIPPTLHFQAPNPRIAFAGSPFFVNKTLIPWEPKGMPRRAGVSSFGFCGTNAHVIFEEPPASPASPPPARAAQLFLMSARHPQALEDGAKRLGEAIAVMHAGALADAAYTTQVGRKRYEHRRCAVISSASAAAATFSQPQGAASASLKSDAQNPSVAFLFPGQGAQYVNMGLRLYQREPIFKDAIDRCATLLAPHLKLDLRSFLFPVAGDEATATESLNNTFYTQPAIFTVSYALAALLGHFGIVPTRFIGHSIGEFVAATLAGVMDLEAALRLVATRGRLMQGLPKGSMLSVRLPADKIQAVLPEGVDLAAVNSPRLCVAAGPTETLAAWAETLGRQDIVCRMLHTSHAFHSSMMDPVVEPFLRTVETVDLRPPRIPFVSTVTGTWAKPEDATDPAYWARHLRSTVRFSEAVQVLLADHANVLVECGPRRTCQTLALQHRPLNPARVLATMPDSGEPDDEHTSFLLALGSLWMNGCDLDIAHLHDGELRRRVPLPTYAFQRKRYWIDPGTVPVNRAVAGHATTPIVPEQTGAVVPASASPDANSDNVEAVVFGIVEGLLGTPLESRDPDATFMALGLDSLLLTQMARAVRLRLAFEATFRDLTQKYSSPRLLAAAVRGAGACPVPTHAVPPVAPPVVAVATVAVAPTVVIASITPVNGTDIEATVFGLVEELLGNPLESRDGNAPFIAMGLDSLLLTQMARGIRHRLGFEVSFRDLTQKYSNPRLLVDAIRVARTGASAALAEVAPAAKPAVALVPPTLGAAPTVGAKDRPGARLGRDAHGKPAWFVPDPNRPGKYVQVPSHDEA